MKDRRFVDDLSFEELERILLIKRREARLDRLRQMDRADHVVGRDPLEPPPPASVPPPIPTEHLQFQGVGASTSYHAVEIEERGRRALKGRIVRWARAPLKINWRFVFNGILLLVELAAVVGLAVVVMSAWRDREEINQAAQEVLVVLPSPTPTVPPVIKGVVLPGGHTPPDARGFSQPEPIPRQLQALAAAITPQPIPTRGPEHATRLVIPAIGVDHPVVEGDDWEALKRGVGHTPWSANPGEIGNCVLSAHNDIFGEIFGGLAELELGDEIFVHTGSQVYRYVVTATRIVESTQMEVTNRTEYPRLTLISSYPYLVDDRRIAVIAELAPTSQHERGGKP